MASPIYGIGNSYYVQALAGKARGVAEADRLTRMYQQQDLENQMRQSQVQQAMQQQAWENQFKQTGLDADQDYRKKQMEAQEMYRKAAAMQHQESMAMEQEKMRMSGEDRQFNQGLARDTFEMNKADREESRRIREEQNVMMAAYREEQNRIRAEDIERQRIRDAQDATNHQPRGKEVSADESIKRMRAIRIANDPTASAEDKANAMDEIAGYGLTDMVVDQTVPVAPQKLGLWDRAWGINAPTSSKVANPWQLAKYNAKRAWTGVDPMEAAQSELNATAQTLAQFAQKFGNTPPPAIEAQMKALLEKRRQLSSYLAQQQAMWTPQQESTQPAPGSIGATIARVQR